MNLYNKTARKLCFAAISIFMLSLSTFSALASDLKDYPGSFITGNTFDGYIVVGDKAAAEDVIGAVDIATSLQIPTTDSDSSQDTTQDVVSTKIEKSSDNLNIGDKIKDVKETLTKDDLPNLLGDDTYENDEGAKFGYSQKIVFGAVPSYTLFKSNAYNRNKPVLGIDVKRNTELLRYVLSFKKDAEGDTNWIDFEDTEITLMGQDYDIVDTESSNSLILMSGVIKDVLEQGQNKQYEINGKDYTVEVLYISNDKAKVKVNGFVSEVLYSGDTFRVGNDLYIGIKDVMEEEAGETTNDQVELWIGAKKLILANGDNLEVNDVEIEDINVEITKDGNNIEAISLIWTPDEELFVTETKEVLFPAFESFKLLLGPLTTSDEEQISLTPDSDNVIQMTVPLAEGEVTFDLLTTNGNNITKIGGEDYTLFTTPGNNHTGMTTDDLFVATNLNDKESHIIEVSRFKTDGVYFTDLSDNNEKSAKLNEMVEFGNVKFKVTALDIDNELVNITLTNSDTFSGSQLYTNNGMLIEMPTITGGSSFVMAMTENDGATFTAKINAVGDVEVQSMAGVSMLEDKDLKVLIGYVPSDISSRIELTNDKDQEELTIFHYGDESYGNLYVAERDAVVAETGAASAINRVSIGAARLASEITSLSLQNLIVVGGPCANNIAAELMDSTEECTLGFEEGKAVLKLFDLGNNHQALLVAGMYALDTRRASRVLANWKNYNLSGNEVEVTGTDLTNIQVSAIEQE